MEDNSSVPVHSQNILLLLIEGYFNFWRSKFLGPPIFNQTTNSPHNLACSQLKPVAKEMSLFLLSATAVYVISSKVLNNYEYLVIDF